MVHYFKLHRCPKQFISLHFPQMHYLDGQPTYLKQPVFSHISNLKYWIFDSESWILKTVTCNIICLAWSWNFYLDLFLRLYFWLEQKMLWASGCELNIKKSIVYNFIFLKQVTWLATTILIQLIFFTCSYISYNFCPHENVFQFCSHIGSNQDAF